ncbi:diguanylate cyclase domain-containing protein [Pelosinus sp. UFO1]|uniref:diguanylate cyclase domain-containing protein n=1 Tax=Pelosinus sp. UFO1 TaxID=484770 RepID=UPI0004D192B4|nr:diguanylate cyclase [Pelosinus sp. UFO1]AIF49989.1 diguanylate cyclase with PAS/PAC sensor [Pelosinus sp. UFO1]
MKNRLESKEEFLCKINKPDSKLLGKKGYCCSLDKDSGGVRYAFHVSTRKIIEVNDAFLALLKYSSEDVTDLYVEDIIVAELQEIESNINKILNYGLTEISLRQYRCKDGDMLFVESSFEIVNLYNEQYLVATIKDVTEWQQLQNRLRLAAQVFESASDGILVTDVEGVIQFANPAFLKNTGYSLEEIMGLTPRILKSGIHSDELYHEMWHSLQKNGQWKGEINNKRKNGEIYSEWLVVDAIKNDLGQITMYSGIFRDLSERMKYEEKIKFHAYHDGLTGLPNRILFYEKMSQCFNAAKRYRHIMGVMYVDLDGFKYVNDTFGHDKGDLLLQAVALGLKECVRESDIVARMGGDEFTIILPEMARYQEAEVVAKKIQERLNQTFILLDCAVKISSSIGVSIFPKDGEDADTLIKKADNAMYQAKAAGKNTYRFSNNG